MKHPNAPEVSRKTESRRYVLQMRYRELIADELPRDGWYLGWFSFERFGSLPFRNARRFPDKRTPA